MGYSSYKVQIPYQLLDACIGKTVTDLQVFLLLKKRCSGQIKITPKIVSEISVQIERHEKTVLNAIKKLQNKKWILTNPKTGCSWIRGFKTILNVDKFKAAEFDLTQIKILKSFCFCALVKFIIKNREHFLKVNRYSNWQCTKSWLQKEFLYSPNHIANKTMAKELQRSIPTIINYFKKGVKDGFLTREADFMELSQITEILKNTPFIESNLFCEDKEYRKFLQMGTPDLFRKIVGFKDKEPLLQLPNITYSNIKTKTFKKDKKMN